MTPQDKNMTHKKIETKDKLWVSQREAATLLGVGASKVRNLMDAGELAWGFDGSRRKISTQSIRDYVTRVTGDMAKSVGLDTKEAA